MNAREFFTNTFNTGFLFPDELETIIKAMELYAYDKCKEQREECYDSWLHMPEWKEDSVEEYRERGKQFILNALCPVVLPNDERIATQRSRYEKQIAGIKKNNQ
jgi:hypothetical protein